MPTTSRKACRSGQRCEIRSLAEAVDCVAHHSDIGLRDIAERIGVSESYLRTACSQYDDSHRFQAALIVPVTLATRNFAILDFLEQQAGRVAIRLPEADASRGDVFERTAALVRELGEAIEEIRRSLADGHVSAEEADRVRREIQQVHQAAAALEAAVVCQVGDRKGAPGEIRRVS